MPHELKSTEEITDELLNNTLEVRRKGAGEFIKYKFRTPSMLYTIKVPQEDSSQVESIIQSSRDPIEIINLS